MKKKIALFGGSFDPFHTDHLNIAKSCYQNLGFDEVWLIPTFLNPFKIKQNSTIHDRLQMLEIIKNKYHFIKVSEFEIKQNRSVPTYETVLHFINNFSDYQFCFIMGSDQLDKFEEWNNFEQLIKVIEFKIFKRDQNYNKKILQKYNLELFEFDNNHLRSTDIRNLKNLDKQIPEINDYVNNNLLYLYERLESQMDHKRYIHCINVGQMASKLAKKWGLDSKKALVAGTLHDITKRWDQKKTQNYLQKYLPELLNEPEPVWHSYTGYLHLKYDWLINDQEILSAVFNHTVGSENMTILDIVVFCADKISSERTYDNVEQFRELCFTDLMKGFKLLLKNQYQLAVSKHGRNNIGSNLIKTVNHFLGKNYAK
ncbi:nicotinate-nucleotide adenylyltransferase [Mycoplasma putrefaciens]|uniref:Probable nicotinate-nucleotide adenylyltransferase n=1 Tax=Mycoplasma putrefaciens Mput9231 TaxID=1292033 RepID=M9WHD5_9MOLU|nr:nicotinate-nucleotide adenylyltransferase [Mycoplasma putrefaciens]AGJ90799.1 Putative nicotinate-nucleotideadenylyl transferase [Mycoplasma putrefaciens Mput9231]